MDRVPTWRARAEHEIGQLFLESVYLLPDSPGGDVDQLIVDDILKENQAAILWMFSEEEAAEGSRTFMTGPLKKLLDAAFQQLTWAHKHLTYGFFVYIDGGDLSCPFIVGASAIVGSISSFETC